CINLLYRNVDERYVDQHSSPTRRSSDLPSVGIDEFVIQIPPNESIAVTRRHREFAVYSSKLHLFIRFSNLTIVRIKRNGIRNRCDWKSTRLNSSHISISYAVFCSIKDTN